MASKVDYKTLMLVILVITSIILSYKIWFEGSYTVENASNVSINFKDIETVIRPEKIYANYGGPFHSLMVGDIYDRAWMEFINIIKEYGTLKNKNPVKIVNNITWDNIIRRRSIRYVFASDIEYDMFSKLFDFKLDTPPKYIGDIVIISGENPIMYIKDITSSAYYQIDLGYIPNNINTLIAAAEKLNSINYSTSYELGFNDKIRSDVYIPVDTAGFKYDLVRFYGRTERDIQKRFFLDFSIVREIEQEDGTIIYTDGKKGLRIYPYNKLEFNDSSFGYRNVDIVTAVKMAIQFIKDHGGIDEGIYFKSIKTLKKDQKIEYNIAFGYEIEGIPVYMSDGNYIDIKISYDNIQEYNRWLKSVEVIKQKVAVVNGIKAIDTVYQNVHTADFISNLDLVYYLNPETNKCNLVWKIDSGGKTYLVDATDARWMGE